MSQRTNVAAPSESGDARRRWPAESCTQAWAIVWLILLYLPLTTVLASKKQLWNDELFTYYIARLPSLRDIWAVLLTAVDQNPPLFYWISHASMQLGDEPLWIRLPAIAGFGLMAVCLIVFVAHRLPPWNGLLAAMIALLSGAYPYSQEARPYGLVLGFGALALVCWQRSGSHRHGSWWAAGLAISLGLAVSSHYYAVLLFIPFIAAEATVWLIERKVRWVLLVALLVASLPLVVYIPLIQSARGYSQNFWAKATIRSAEEYFMFLLGPALLPVGAVAVWAFLRQFTARRKDVVGPPMFVPWPEIVAISGFLSIPFFAVLLALTVTGAFTFRYALAGLIGLSVCGAWMFAVLFRMRARPTLIAAVVLSLFFSARHVRSFRYVGQQADHNATMQWMKDRLPAGSRVAVTDPHLFFEIVHANDRELGTRLFYVADAARALTHVGTDTVDRGLWGMQTLARLPVGTLKEVLSFGQPFFVYGDPSTYGWLTQELISYGLSLTVVDRFEGRWLLLAAPQTR